MTDRPTMTERQRELCADLVRTIDATATALADGQRDEYAFVVILQHKRNPDSAVMLANVHDDAAKMICRRAGVSTTGDLHKLKRTLDA